MKAYIIHLPQFDHSRQHAADMLSQLRGFGIDADLFVGIPGDQAIKIVQQDSRAIYPFGIKTTPLEPNDLKRYIKPELWEEFRYNHFWNVNRRHLLGDDAAKIHRPGVIGCFLSHYSLWRKCMELDEPIMIFEDDVIIYRGYQPVSWEDVLILSLGKKSFRNEPWHSYLESPSMGAMAVPWPNYSMPGASGYAIKPKAARRLVKRYNKYYCAADNAMNKSFLQLHIHTHLMGRNRLPEEGDTSMTKFNGW